MRHRMSLSLENAIFLSIDETKIDRISLWKATKKRNESHDDDYEIIQEILITLIDPKI